MSRFMAIPSLVAPSRAWRAVRRGAALLCAGAPVALAALAGCSPAPNGAGSQGVALQDDSAALEEISDEKVAPPAPSLKDLGPSFRRVTVIVLPGDASVEVDGFTARRRDGIIEIMGQVGELRRLRVFKGTQKLERDVTIEDAGASPPMLDLSSLPVSHEVWQDEGKAPKPAKAKSVLLPEEFD